MRISRSLQATPRSPKNESGVSWKPAKTRTASEISPKLYLQMRTLSKRNDRGRIDEVNCKKTETPVSIVGRLGKCIGDIGNLIFSRNDEAVELLTFRSQCGDVRVQIVDLRRLDFTDFLVVQKPCNSNPDLRGNVSPNSNLVATQKLNLIFSPDFPCKSDLR